jgi:hypothetical protein
MKAYDYLSRHSLVSKEEVIYTDLNLRDNERAYRIT